MRNKVFLDTSYAIAIVSPKDDYYKKALEIADILESQSINLITTQAILLEIGNALSKLKYRQVAISLLNSLEIDPKIEIISLSNELYQEAFKLYSQRQDKEWGLVDCLSFIVMKKQQITEALTADIHFEQAGFKALLRE
jgi:predicted nucleic acid-binding protein